MNIYNETMSGGSLAAGCSPALVGFVRNIFFGPGDVAFNAAKAQRGRIEKVVIKSIRTVTSRRTFLRNQVLYVDTLNGLWNEDDLITFDEAEALVEAYWQNVKVELGKLSSCS